MTKLWLGGTNAPPLNETLIVHNTATLYRRVVQRLWEGSHYTFEGYSLYDWPTLFSVQVGLHSMRLVIMATLTQCLYCWPVGLGSILVAWMGTLPSMMQPSITTPRYMYTHTHVWGAVCQSVLLCFATGLYSDISGL